MDAEAIAAELLADATTLHGEVAAVADGLERNTSAHRFRYAHYGYLMACMGQFDLLSRCEFGVGEPQGGQTVRMRSFMPRYLDAHKTDEHTVAIQLMRHTLMHTGALRFLYDRQAQVAYTWRVHFNGLLPAGVAHYTLSTEDAAYQDVLLSAVNGQVAVVKALNVRLTNLSADVVRVARAYTTEMLGDPMLRHRCEAAYAGVCVQSVTV